MRKLTSSTSLAILFLSIPNFIFAGSAYKVRTVAKINSSTTPITSIQSAPVPAVTTDVNGNPIQTYWNY